MPIPVKYLFCNFVIVECIIDDGDGDGDGGGLFSGFYVLIVINKFQV